MTVWLHLVDGRLMEGSRMNVIALSERAPAKGAAKRTPRKTTMSMTLARTSSELSSRLRSERPDLVVLESSRRALVPKLLDQDPHVAILIVNDIDEFQAAGSFGRVVGLAGLGSNDRRKTTAQSPAHTVSALHDPTSGRVDAARVAAFFGVSLAEMARILGRSPQSVHKTPDAPALQNALGVLIRIATALTTLFTTPENARVWLNAPHPDLDRTRPIELVKQRKADVVAELLEDALLGHPS
jgi:hypothetical protein